MKQARAFGVGVLIATQNPMDLDYRALSHAGLWRVGRLQTTPTASACSTASATPAARTAASPTPSWPTW
jgi:DNA helicase HerA-like ATPase